MLVPFELNFKISIKGFAWFFKIASKSKVVPFNLHQLWDTTNQIK